MLEKIKSRPIRKNNSFAYDDYLKNKSFYHQKIICQLELSENYNETKEPLCSCAESGLLVQNYYYKSALLQKFSGAEQYLSADVFLRQSIIRDLLIIDQFLAQYQLRLLILSGYRHPALQLIILNQVSKLKGEKFARKMYSDPNFYSPHSTGAAIDLEIWDKNNACLLPTKFKGVIGRYYLEEKKNLNLAEVEIRNNRRLIHNLLTTDILLKPEQQFIGHPFEYWHYGRNERLSAFFDGNNHPVFYEMINSSLTK